LPFFSAKIKKTKNQALPCYFVIGSAATCWSWHFLLPIMLLCLHFWQYFQRKL
jgi:hypothetical protein